MRLVKLLAYHWAARGDPASLAADAQQSLDRARALGFEELAARQRAALDVVWAHADIELDGDPEIQHALRYALFQLHQNTACAAGHAIPAKGLTGAGYNGHTFWDTEIFLLPGPDLLRHRITSRPRCAGAPRRCPRRRPRRAASGCVARRSRGERSRGGVLGLPAGRHGGVPRQRRHRARGHALRGGHRRRALRARGRRAAAGRDRAAVGQPRLPRRAPRRALLDRRRDRARRVLRAGRQQPLHQPHGPGQPARRGRRRRAPRTARRSASSRAR